MDRYTIWCMYFASVGAMRFHPRNVVHGEAQGPYIECELDFARKVADAMLDITEDVWPPSLGESSPESEPSERVQ